MVCCWTVSGSVALLRFSEKREPSTLPPRLSGRFDLVAAACQTVRAPSAQDSRPPPAGRATTRSMPSQCFSLSLLIWNQRSARESTKAVAGTGEDRRTQERPRGASCLACVIAKLQRHARRQRGAVGDRHLAPKVETHAQDRRRVGPGGILHGSHGAHRPARGPADAWSWPPPAAGAGRRSRRWRRARDRPGRAGRSATRRRTAWRPPPAARSSAVRDSSFMPRPVGGFVLERVHVACLLLAPCAGWHPRGLKRF